MTWQANLVIVNNTTNNITMVHNTLGEIGIISGNQTFNWSTTETNNTVNFNFWNDPNMYFMTSVFNFGPDQISYINRGLLPQEAQDIRLIVSNVSGAVFQQFNGLGGLNFLYDLFQNGDTLTWTYDSFSTPEPLSTTIEDQ